MATVAGLADHYGWTAVVVVGPDGTVVDRRRAELVAEGLTPCPFHHDAQDLPLEEGIALVRQVERSVVEHARALGDALEANFGVAALAIREIPKLPADIGEQITSYHAQTRADGAMYRRVLAEEATRRGWPVHFYDHRGVEKEAIATLDLGVDHLAAPRTALGAPWTADHRKAYAAALLVQQAPGHLPS